MVLISNGFKNSYEMNTSLCFESMCIGKALYKSNVIKLKCKNSGDKSLMLISKLYILKAYRLFMLLHLMVIP